MNADAHWMIKVEDGFEYINGSSFKKIIFKETFSTKKNMLKKLEKIRRDYDRKEIKIFQRIKSEWCLYPDA